MATNAIEIRSPAVSSMSSSRGGGCGLTWLARSSSSSVLSPMAETATQTSLPAFLASAIRRATRLMLAASASEEPPYFWTTMGTVLLLGPRRAGAGGTGGQSIGGPHRGTRVSDAGRDSEYESVGPLGRAPLAFAHGHRSAGVAAGARERARPW